MAHIWKFGLVGPTLLLMGLSATAFADTVTVGSLAGLRTAINNAPYDGRTITVKRGVYRQTAPIYIRHKNHLTITGATSNYNDTVLRGPGINNRRLDANFKLNNADHITIKNLTVRDSFYHGIQANNDSDHFTADNVRTVDNGESGFKVTSPRNASGPSAYSDYGVIKNSWIGFTRTGRRGTVEGIDIVGAKGWVIRHDTFKNIKKPHGGAAYAAFAKGNSIDITFEENTVKDSFIGLSFGGGGTNPIYFRNGDTVDETRGGVIRDNLIYHLADAGIYMNKAHAFKIYGNTVIDNGKRTGAVGVRYKQSYGVVRNNRLSGPIKERDGGIAITHDNTFISANTPIPSSP